MRTHGGVSTIHKIKPSFAIYLKKQLFPLLALLTPVLLLDFLLNSL
jgi:hypothetical protein